MLNIFKIEATTLPDLWFQAVYNILTTGKRYRVDKGSFRGENRLEYDYFIGHVTHPSDEPLIPKMPSHIDVPDPVQEEYMCNYISYLMSPEKKDNESYTYGERLSNVAVDGVSFSQIDEAIRLYKEHGYGNNQVILQVANTSDMKLSDPPCLRHIDTKIMFNTLHFFAYFRSWDLWAGLPANLAAIQTLKKYMAEELGLNDGELVVESKGLHLYGYAETLARKRCRLE